MENDRRPRDGVNWKGTGTVPGEERADDDRGCARLEVTGFKRSGDGKIFEPSWVKRQRNERGRAQPANGMLLTRKTRKKNSGNREGERDKVH